MPLSFRRGGRPPKARLKSPPRWDYPVNKLISSARSMLQTSSSKTFWTTPAAPIDRRCAKMYKASNSST